MHRNWRDWCVLAYYAGFLALGVAAVDVDNGLDADDAIAAVMAVLGVAGVLAWLGRRPQPEAIILWTLAALRVVQGVSLMADPRHDQWAAGASLLLAPLTMVPLGWYRWHRPVELVMRDVIRAV